MECEVCGKLEGPYLTLIEGARLHACANCARMGKILQAPSGSRAMGGPGAGGYGGAGAGGAGGSGAAGGYGSGHSLASAAPEYELVDGFGAIMRSARMRMHLPLAVLAEKIAEKESFLERIEHQTTHPSEAIARKIEKELGIQLLEAAGDVGATVAGAGASSSSSGGVTLGDILQIEQRKKKKADGK
jgi:ribosome-binding protein aMBF1 (putative translation factor)